MSVTIEDIQSLVGLQMGRRRVLASDRFAEDLGTESFDVVNIAAAAEDKYQITLGETDISRVRTVQDLYDLIKKRL